MGDVALANSNWLCRNCLFRAVANGNLQIADDDGSISCTNCGDTVGRPYCEACATCPDCDQVAEACETHAKAYCGNCSDSIHLGDETVYCGSCGSHDECSSGEYCWECGNTAEIVACERHTPFSRCSECDTTDQDVACRECANDLWFAGAVPLIVIEDDGAITVGDTEVRWN